MNAVSIAKTEPERGLIKTEPDSRLCTLIQRPLGTKNMLEITQDATGALAKQAISCQINPMLMVRMAETGVSKDVIMSIC